MSKITTKLNDDAKIWAPDYETDFRLKSLKNYMIVNNLTKKTYIIELREEIRNNKKLINQINNKEANRYAQARWRENNKQKRYIGNIIAIINYTKLNKDNKPYDFIKNEIINFDSLTTKKNIHNEALKLIEKFIINKIEESSILDAKIESFITNINPHQDNTRLQSVRMRNSNSCIIDGYSKQSWDTNTGRCVFDYIINRYGNIKGFKGLCNYQDLHDVFTGMDDSINLFENGVNTDEIRNFCEDRKIPMYALNDEEKVFEIYQPENRNRNGQSLVFRISNGHFYPVEDQSKIKKATHQNQIRSVLFETIVEKPSYEADIDIKTVEYCNDIMESIKNHIANKQIPQKISMHNNELMSYWIDGCQFITNKNIEINKELCENMNKNYVGQGAGTLLFNIVEETIDTIPKSTPNNEVYIKLIQAKKDRTHIGFINDENNTDGCETIDVCKSYSYSVYNMEEFMIFDFNDNWEHYKGEMKTGLYYIITDDLKLFKGNNIYSNKIIEKGLKENIDFQILYQLIPSKKIPNIFKPLIDKILEYSKGNTKISKLLVNMLTGMFGKSDCKKSKCFINNNLEEIFCFINDYRDKGVKIFINKIDGTDFYLYGYNLEQQLNETNIPMYIQVVDDNNIRLYDMMKHAGGELVARKVDCCIVRNPNAITECDEWGGYRYSPNPTIVQTETCSSIELVIDKDYRDYYINDSDDWLKIYKVLEREGGLLLQGDAGKGKTYTAKQIINKIGKDKVKVLAPINKAALNIGGSTIHSFLKMNKKGNINPKLIKIIEKKYDYIVIDEISMITKELWKRLCVLKRSCPNIKFLLLGDNKQIPPVEDEEYYGDYFNHPAMKYICNNNRNTLTVLKRYDEELYNILCNVDIIKTNDFPNEICKTNICYYNSTRKTVNAYWNKNEKIDGSLFIKENIYDKYSQDMYIYKSLPVICHKTKREKNFILCANSEAFKVSNYDNKNIYLWNERPNDNGDPEIYRIKMPINIFNEYFLLNYCTTTHKVQGTTITDNFKIHDWNRMDTKLRYTALSRAKNVNQISFEKCIKTDKFHNFNYTDKNTEDNEDNIYKCIIPIKKIKKQRKN